MSAVVPPAAPAEPPVDPDRVAAAQELGQAFKGTMGAVRRLRGRETHQPGELSDAQYHALFCLRDTDAMATGEIAIAADVSPASATEMLEGLARAGFVRRIRSERDRRVVLSSLTDRGRELVEERHTRFQSRFQSAMAQFGADELRTAASVLDALRGVFEELAEERVRS